MIWGGTAFATTGKMLSLCVDVIKRWHNPQAVQAGAPDNPLGLRDRFLGIWNRWDILTSILGGSLGAHYNNWIGQWLGSPCEHYKKYIQVDISDLSHFESLLQFEKYILGSDNSYVNAGDSCRDGDKKIAGLTQPLIQFGGQYKEMAFSLCNYGEGQKRKLPLPQSSLDQYVGIAALGGLGFWARVHFQVWGG